VVVLRILDRYLLREILLPFLIGLLVLTFVLEIPVILRDAEQLIAKGVEWTVIVRVLLTLLPQALALTIPMALLLGILVALGRLSGDREFVALQACGVSLYRLMRPIAVIAVVATAADAYEMIVALPNANQQYREIAFGVVAARIESNVKPQVFFEDFPNRVVYVRDVPPTGGWRDVFLADTSRADQTDVFFAKEGRLLVDREKRTVQLQLMHGTQYTTSVSKPDEYQGHDFESQLLKLDPETVFPRPPAKGITEKTIAELRSDVASGAARGDPGYLERFVIQQKFSIPVACLVLALIGLALGVSNRKDGMLASFVLGFVVIFAYYVLLWTSRALAMSGRIPATPAPWIPNIVLGAAGIALALWRAGSADEPIRISIPTFWRERPSEPPAGSPIPGPSPRPVVLVIRIPHFNVPRPRLLDLYVSRQYVQVFLLGLAALLGIFYISRFMDLADKLFKGTATTGMLLRYFFYQTPQYVYYIIPMSVLIATLVTIGRMTKNSELVVMKACGVSLYRVAMPLLFFALAASGVLFVLQEQVLADSNREAQRLDHIIRGYPPQTFGLLNRRWIVGNNGDIYHYDFFDPQANRFVRLSTYHVDPQNWTLKSLGYASDVHLVRLLGAAPRDATGAAQPLGTIGWRAFQGWTRDFTIARRRTGVTVLVNYAPFTERDVPLEPPAYFKAEQPESDQMTYGQLKHHISQLRVSGFNATAQTVELRRRIAFPLVTVVMTLLAVPFAVTTGRRGALYGVGVGIVLAIVYWITLSVLAALGAGGLIAPTLAAWAPNILFAAAAMYLVLTVRT
jgi:LPS export ABC transporter permease LptF